MLALSALITAAAQAQGAENRRVIPLDGVWQIAEGAMDAAPAKYDRRVPVPGLADMAQPAFDDVGTPKSNDLRKAFWYRRAFTIEGAVPPISLLKIHKAMFGTRVILNGKLLGDHIPCFTPGWFDAREALKGGGAENELVIRVGAYRDAVTRAVPDGFDFEKVKYIPGIYDSVEMILTGSPYIERIQVAPNLNPPSARVAVWLRNAGSSAIEAKAKCAFREAASRKDSGVAAELSGIRIEPGQSTSITLDLGIDNCHPWTPETPFLYEVEVDTGADTLRDRFGMRTFRFDVASGRAFLNGKPYFMRGTNVCIYRFFEDPVRKDLPWRGDWVRRLHRQFKSMNWNCARYCIGFPPEQWYRIADEEGFMIQDEFPIWFGGNKWPDELKSPELIKEYTEWMQERWNHPSVVIWDAQNETAGPKAVETGTAIASVRGLDLSDRPWDNGWSAAQGPNDPYESHPYQSGNASFRLSRLKTLKPKPAPSHNQIKEDRPCIINEYAWLWLNRDGTPCTLSKKFYESFLGPNATPAQLREAYARLLAAKTEFWRSHRQMAAVMHFCGLGYSRPGGQTSDNFINVETLEFEPNFANYVRDSFAPVGLMIDDWDDVLTGGQTRKIPVAVINDLYEEWQGAVALRIIERGSDGKAIFANEMSCKVAGLGREEVTFEAPIPAKSGNYQLVAQMQGAGKKPVRSWRDFEILSEERRKERQGLAVGKKATASSVVTDPNGTYPPEQAVDGKDGTRWSSQFSDPQWLAVDLGEPRKIARVQLKWEPAYGKAYQIQVSDDGEKWKDVYKTESGKGGVEEIKFAPVEARYVRIYGTQRATQYGYSLYEFAIFPAQ
ncbi:MAG: discoidin domain-containing protein [Candidatus Sumerlaeota bacterium]|nr:discoidin domain-containing protein [Candidatus Sumerlaeota bacterium]